MAISYQTSYSELYTIGATDTGVLALVNAVFPREQLGATAGRVLPWLVWQYGAVSGERGEMSDLNAVWWIYIAPAANPRTFYTIVAALEAAYVDRWSVDFGQVRPGKPGAPFVDESLNNLQGMRVPLIFRTLG